MNFSKGLLAALAVASTLTAGNAFAQPAGDTSGSGGSGSGTGGAAPGDFSSAWFVSPLPNASFDVAPATLDAEIGVYSGVDDSPISTIELSVDEVSIGTQDCPTGCTFADIELAQGVHTLTLVADIGYTTSTLVYVDEEIPGGTDTGTDTGAGTGSESGTSGGGTGDGGGGGCSTNEEPTSRWGLLAIPVLVLVSVARRRR